MNKVIISGRITRDVVVTQTKKKNVPVAYTVLAFNKNFLHNGEWKRETHYFDLKAFGKTVEKMKKLQKGDKVLVEGILKTEKYQKNGKTFKRTRIVPTKIEVLKKKAVGKKEERNAHNRKATN